MTKLLKYLKPIFIVALIIYLFDQGGGWIRGRAIESISIEIQKFSIYFLYSAVLGSSNFWVVEKLEQRYSWKEEPKKRAVYGAVGAVLVSMLSIIMLRLVTVLVFEKKSWDYYVQNESIYMYVYSLIITLVVVLVFYVINFYRALTKQTITKHQTIAKTETARFETLKSQLDPHFLFNSLNVLTALIEENPTQAERFTTKLSKVYRYVLEQKDKDLILLLEELEFAAIYMELLKMRFEENLEFDLPKEFSNPEFKIVPLSLQLLLENAVKHNATSTENPLKITITIQNGELVIANNVHEKKSVTKGAGVGLQNIIERYALLTEKQVKINQSINRFEVILPLLTQKTTNMKTSNINEENKYIKARDRVEKIKAFYSNVLSYVIIIPFLAILNYMTSWEHKWFIYPMLGWGIGVIFHYFEAFGRFPFLGSNWEEKKIKELMDEENKELWE